MIFPDSLEVYDITGFLIASKASRIVSQNRREVYAILFFMLWTLLKFLPKFIMLLPHFVNMLGELGTTA